MKLEWTFHDGSMTLMATTSPICVNEGQCGAGRGGEKGERDEKGGRTRVAKLSFSHNLREDGHQ